MPYINIYSLAVILPPYFSVSPYRTLGVTPPPVSMHAPVIGCDRYLFVDPNWACSLLPHGIFVFATNETPPIQPALTIRYPDRSVAYNVVVK